MDHSPPGGGGGGLENGHSGTGFLDLEELDRGTQLRLVNLPEKRGSLSYIKIDKIHNFGLKTDQKKPNDEKDFLLF